LTNVFSSGDKWLPDSSENSRLMKRLMVKFVPAPTGAGAAS
jgi:hypothetical protein